MHNPLHRLNVDEILMIIQLFAKFKPDYKFDRENVVPPYLLMKHLHLMSLMCTKCKEMGIHSVAYFAF